MSWALGRLGGADFPLNSTLADADVVDGEVLELRAGDAVRPAQVEDVRDLLEDTVDRSSWRWQPRTTVAFGLIASSLALTAALALPGVLPPGAPDSLAIAAVVATGLATGGLVGRPVQLPASRTVRARRRVSVGRRGRLVDDDADRGSTDARGRCRGDRCARRRRGVGGGGGGRWRPGLCRGDPSEQQSHEAGGGGAAAAHGGFPSRGGPGTGSCRRGPRSRCGRAPRSRHNAPGARSPTPAVILTRHHARLARYCSPRRRGVAPRRPDAGECRQAATSVRQAGTHTHARREGGRRRGTRHRCELE